LQQRPEPGSLCLSNRRIDMTNAAANRTILVVDDTDDVRELVRMQLVMLGYRVMEASNGREAVKKLSKKPPKLTLMNLSRQVLGGIKATRLFAKPEVIRML